MRDPSPVPIVRRLRRTATTLLLIAAVLAPGLAHADAFDAPTGDRSLLTRVGTGRVAVGASLPAEPATGWIATSFPVGLAGQSFHGGIAYPLVDSANYQLETWAEVGPSFLVGGQFAFAVSADLGARALFGAPPIRWSTGLGLDSSFELAPRRGSRYRPVGRLGLGWEPALGGWLPDAVWLRGSLGYDLRPGRLGAADIDIWLSMRWSFDADAGR